MNELEGYANDLLYIPGNHDPSTLFAKDKSKLPVLGSNINGNIHKGIYKLREDLVVIGLGGSVVDYVQETPTSPLVPCWEKYTYPYFEADHKEFNQDLDELWAETMQLYPDEKVKIIIMTHEGPYGSGTSRNHYFETGQVFHAGSPHLRDLILKNQSRIVCNIHGHTHEGAFMQNVGSVAKPLQIINPGSLKQAEFGEVVVRQSTTGDWEVVRSTKNFL